MQTVSALPDGGCMLAGEVSLADPAPIFCTARIEPNGLQQWSNGVWYDPNELWSMAYAPFVHCANGDVVAFGVVEYLGGSAVNADHFAARYGVDGTLKWLRLYDLQEVPDGCWWAGAFAGELANGELLFGGGIGCYLCTGSNFMLRADGNGHALDAFRTDTLITADSLYIPRITGMTVQGSRVFSQGVIQAKAVGGFFWAEERPYLSIMEYGDTSVCFVKPMTLPVLITLDTSLFYAASPGPSSSFGGAVVAHGLVNETMASIASTDLCTLSVPNATSERILISSVVNAMPNPFSESTMLRYAFPTGSGLVTLEVRDALGRSVRRVQLVAGSTSTAVDLGGQPGGVYVAELRSAGSLIGTVRLLKE